MTVNVKPTHENQILTTDDSSPDEELQWTQFVRVMQIITGALVAGVGAYFAYAVISAEEFSDSPGLMTSIAIGLAVLAIAAKLIVPGMIGSGKDAKSPTDLIGIYQTRLIVGLALLEGSAFLNITMFTLEQHWWLLAATGVQIILMLASWPTRSKVEFWIRTQQEMATLESR